jgi:cyclopropane fatty-acyl-phospholipid synthase-like methyltransferase
LGLPMHAVAEGQAMDQIEFYELHAAKVDDAFTEPPRALQLRDICIVNRIRRMQQSTGRPLQVTELSIGDGHLTRRLLASGDIELACAEISSRRIERLKRWLSTEPQLTTKNVVFVECNLDTQWSFPANASDAVIALDILEHVFDVFGFIANCRKVLRQDGLLLLRVPNVAFIRHRMRLLFGLLPITASWFGPPGELNAWRENYGWDGGHLHLFTIPILRKLLQEQGFMIENCSDAGARLEGVRSLWPNLLYANPLIVAMKT